ncbi:hypothetical protein ACSDYX_001552 [Escherichia coli]
MEAIIVMAVLYLENHS